MPTVLLKLIALQLEGKISYLIAHLMPVLHVLQAKDMLAQSDGQARFEKHYGRAFIYGCISGGW